MERELRAACRAGTLQRVQELHGQGVSLTATTNDGWQPIHDAAAGGHRDKGFPLVIATQRPADLDKNLRGMITGTRLIGKLEGTDKDRKDLIDTVVKNTDHNESSRDKMKTLQPRQFIHIASGGSDAPQVVESGQLKRLHESSAAWVKGFSPQHPLAAHDEERRAKRARSGAAGSSGRP